MAPARVLHGWPPPPPAAEAPSSEAEAAAEPIPEPAETFIADASDAHLWFTAPAPRSPGHIELRHHPVALEQPYFRPLRVITTRPTHLAASDNQIWMVMPRDAEQIASQRDRRVLSMQAVQSPGFDLYIPEPRDRMRIEDTLPGWGRLVDFAGTVDGPLALLVSNTSPTPAENDTQDENTNTTQPNDNESSHPSVALLQLRNGRWRSIALPGDLLQTRSVRLVTSGVGGRTLTLLAGGASADTSGAQSNSVTHVYRRINQGNWEHATIPLQLTRVVGITRTGPHVVLALSLQTERESSVPPGQGGSLSGRAMHVNPDRVRLVYLHHDQLVELTTMGCPSSGAWQFVGTGNELLLMHALNRNVERESNQSQYTVRIRRIDPLRGTFSDWQQFTIQPTPAGRLWFAGFVITFVVMALVLLLLITPARRVETALPADLAPLPVLARLSALAVDLLPAGVIAKLITGCAFTDLVRIPMFAADFAEAAPFLIMIGLGLSHSTVTECFSRTSLGKVMFGARVVQIDGGAPSAPQLLVRNVLKLIVLLVPPLAVFALFNRDLQLPGDVITRTVVVRPVTAEQTG